MPISKHRKTKKKKIVSKTKKEDYSPACDINIPLLSKIAYDLWPKDMFNKIEGIEGCKLYYNNAYKRLSKEINILLQKYHPASWVREAYMQLEIWTLLWYQKQMKKNSFNVKGPEMFIAAGRYGWRYILEISLEKTESNIIISNERPTKEDVSNMFSLISALTQCAEFSNYLHFMPKLFSSVSIELTPILFLTFPKLNSHDESTFLALHNSLDSRPDLSLYPGFSPEQNETLMSMINKFLNSNFGFTLDEIWTFGIEVLAKICNVTKASIIVHSFDELTELCSRLSPHEYDKIKSLLEFISLDVKDKFYQERNFLVKSQQKRMVNYCGAIIYLKNSLETIYTYEAAKFPAIKYSDRHILLAPTLIGEWLNNFVDRLVYGQRTDLKAINKKINLEISEIEQYYHKQIFEKEVITLLEKKDFQCLTLNKINGRIIDCGEIDVLAYLPLKNELFIIESKNLAPARDAKAAGQLIKDHFEQKKYHQKFIKKIDWINTNLNSIELIFNEKFKQDSCKVTSIKSFFVCGRSSFLKFMVSDYSVLSFVEFDNFLNTDSNDKS